MFRCSLAFSSHLSSLLHWVILPHSVTKKVGQNKVSVSGHIVCWRIKETETLNEVLNAAVYLGTIMYTLTLTNMQCSKCVHLQCGQPE